MSESRVATPQRAAFGPVAILAGLVIATLPVGSVMTIGMGSKLAGFSASQLLIVALAIVLAVVSIRSSSFPDWRRLPLSFVLLGSVSLLAIPVFLPHDRPAAVFAYFNFLTGVVGAVCVGWTWNSVGARRFSAVDAGFVVFVLYGCGQLVFAFLTATGGENLHQSAEVAWGGSNYIAGVLVVAGFAIIGRAWQLRGRYFLLLIPAACALVIPLFSASRGAIVEVAVGAIVIMWSLGRTTVQKWIWRTASIVVPVGAYVLINMAVATRLRSDTQVLKNVDDRFVLYRLSWEQFLGSPGWGTGWTSLRGPSAHALGSPQSFGHNFFLSFLQIGGLLALPFIVCIVVMAVLVVFKGGLLGASAAAALTIAMTDPFFEGTAGSVVSLAVIIFALRQQRNGEPVISLPRRRRLTEPVAR
jgi:hypothetical protein